MARCTAPVYGHRSSAAAARCPACGGRSYYRSSYSYSPPASSYRSGASSGLVGSTRAGSSGGSRSRRTRAGGSVSYTDSEWRSIEPLARKAVEQAREHPERRDLFLCHAWDDRAASASDLYNRLKSNGATVWFSEKNVLLGTPLMREIDRGLAKSRAGLVLVTRAFVKRLKGAGVADKELSALLARELLVPVVHGISYGEVREESPLLASRTGLDTAEDSMTEIAVKISELVSTAW